MNQDHPNFCKINPYIFLYSAGKLMKSTSVNAKQDRGQQYFVQMILLTLRKDQNKT